MVIVSIKDKRFEKPIHYGMERKLKDKLDKKIIPSLQKKDKDFVIALDGAEGSGKSTFAFQIAKYVDNSMDLSRVTFSPEMFREAIYKAKKGQCVIYDEAFTGLSSRASLSGVNKVLVSLMMQMRQKNLFVIIVLPSFFLLDKYVALFRTNILIHVYEHKNMRGFYRIYNRKKKKNLYLLGRMTYSYVPNKVHTKFKGRFNGVFALGDKNEEEKYRKMKDKALKDSERSPMTAGQIKYRDQRDFFVYLFKKYTKMSLNEMANLLADYDIDLHRTQIYTICSKFGDNTEKLEEKKRKKSIKGEEIDINLP